MTTSPIEWPNPARASAFAQWLAVTAGPYRLQVDSVRPASADASFRRYFRIDAAAGSASYIIMDAPPAQEDCAPFVKVAALMREAGVHAPRVLAWDAPQGFMLLSDLGAQTLLDLIGPAAAVDAIARPTQTTYALFMDALDALVRWQLASKPDVLPPYDDALLSRELALFPHWYVGKHRGLALDTGLQDKLDGLFLQIKASNLQSLGGARVYVHRDFMPRNLMITLPGSSNEQQVATPWTPERSAGPPQASSAPSGGSAVREATSVGATVCSAGPPQASTAPVPGERGSAVRDATSVGVLDFQDAVYGPITYDIASLMRDAFLSWEEDFVLDVTVRYWEKARQAGRPVGDDFGEFYRAVEWMGLQRHLKVLGIFARLTLRDGKPRYLADTPRFMKYARATCARYRQLGPLMVLLDEIEGNETRVGYTF